MKLKFFIYIFALVHCIDYQTENGWDP